MQNAVTYCRVSSEEQATKDISIPAQRKALARWADQQDGLRVVDQFVDEGQSAYAPADKRPGFCEMVSFCRKNEVQLILVHKLDRFSRNQEESILFKSLLRKHGVQVKSITEHYDPETPQGFLYEGMIEVINQFYSMNLGTETLKGMRENAERGYHNGGRTPYGYRLERVTDDRGREHSRLALGDDEQVEVVREIFRMATDENMGGRTIANELNKRGHHGPRSKHWNTSSVKTILDNPVYVGDVVWQRSKKNGRRGRKRTAEGEHIVVRDAHPAIVSREVWERQRELAVQRRPAALSKRRRPVSYLLSRLMVCGQCGSTFAGRRHTYKNRRGEKVTSLGYYCGGYLSKGRAVCRSLKIDKDWVEGFVLDIIRRRLCEEDAWGELEAEVVERINGRRARYGQDPARAEKRLADIDRKIDNYYSAIGEGLDAGVCREKIRELTEKKEAIAQEAEVLRKEDYYTRALELNLEQLRRLRAAFAEGFEKLSFGLRRQIVLDFVDTIQVVDRSEIRVRFKVPFDNAGVRHLTDEVTASIEGRPPKREEPTPGAGSSALGAEVDDCRSRPIWLPLLDSNQRPSD